MESTTKDAKLDFNIVWKSTMNDEYVPIRNFTDQ